MSGCTHLEQRLEPIDRRITVLSGLIDRLSGRLATDEDNFGRALALLEDRIRDLEKAPPVSERLDAIDQRITDVAQYYSDMLGLQETSIDRITDRLCRLESRKESRRLRDTAVLYRCNACDPNDNLPPCGCVLSANLGVPDGCIYGAGRPASWKRVDFDLDLGELILDSLMPEGV